MTGNLEFDKAFRALTDYNPLSWQRRLFERLYSGNDIPQVCDLPTGLGKTSVIPIFVIALACQAQGRTVTLPRRLVYVVNRRTVVDQATAIVEQIRERLLEPDDGRWAYHREALVTLTTLLRSLSPGSSLPLAVSTLRGELADNEEWKADPARPAVIIGTIDMIGSKLLFSGYGDDRYSRPQHAGLVGHDSMIVHDEAHLTPAFGELLRQLAAIQRQSHEPRPVFVMELSATARDETGPTFKLESEDELDKIVTDRLDAGKGLHVHDVPAGASEKEKDVRNKALDKIAKLSLRFEDGRHKVLIYVQSPEDAIEIFQKLQADVGGDRTQLLTGTIRGYERDKFVQTPVYQEFLTPSASVHRTVYLVSTSAGEVGIDIDADHLVCDLTTLDSLIQRLGRVNRRGGQGKAACVDMVAQPQSADRKGALSEFQKAMNATLSILKDWAASASGDGVDVSPRNLRALLENLNADRKEKAFSPRAGATSLTDIVLDTWSLTTINGRMPGRPEVAAYLHGLEKEPPETYVVWRKEVKLLSESNADAETLSDWFEWCPIESRERLRDRTDRVRKSLISLLEQHKKKNKDADSPVVLLNERGEALLKDHGENRWYSLSEILAKEFNLTYLTIVLPTEVGGLNDSGALDAKAMQQATDVADEISQNRRRRERWVKNGEGKSYRKLSTEETSEILPSQLRERGRVMLKEPAEDSGEGDRYLILLAEPKQDTETARVHQALEFHSECIVDQMLRACEGLHLDQPFKEALILAAEWHDRGKKRPIWQWYANNKDGEIPLAKSKSYRDGRALGGYRHEFGSLLEAERDKGIQAHPQKDLILHLISAHHGWARPYFEPRAWDNTYGTAENEVAATEAMRRFGRLQQRFGRWGLAWLESLLRCADIAASNLEEQETSETTSQKEVSK